MTKFILHGGYTRVENEDNRKFLEEVTKNSKQILCIYFARERNEWEKRFENDKKKFKFNNLVMANEEELEEQIKESDTIFISGGDTEILKEKLNRINFKDLIKEKTIAGSSVGVYVLVKHYFSNDKKKFADGLGILNLKAFFHYKEEDRKELESLKEYKEQLETLVIPDYKMVVVEI